jgi:hypothetical protein
MRLGAAEIEAFGNNASGLFKQLFTLRLSGSEVAPVERFAILDEGIQSGDANVLSLCVDSLGNVFNNHFIRFGDAGSIGSAPALVDWNPKTRDDVNDFYLAGITRLVNLRKASEELAERCEVILARAIRLMLSTDLYKEYGAILTEISDEKGGWPEAVDGVGDWLYFDRKGAPAELAAFVRQLYLRLFPTDFIGKAILYTKFWQSDIRNPDSIYSESDLDFEYSERQARAVAGEIAVNADLTLEAVRRMTPMDLKTVYPFAVELARLAENRSDAFHGALTIVAEFGGSVPMLRGLLQGIDLVNHDLANACLEEAVTRLAGTRSPIDLYSALQMDKERLGRVVGELRSGRIRAVECVFLSYGRGLDELPPEDVALLLDALGEQDSDGVWTALEIAMMYQYRSPVAPAHARKIAELLTLPTLVGRAGGGQREAHIIEDSLERVRTTIGIDDILALGLAEQVVRLAQSTDYEIVGTLTQPMRDVVTLLVAEKPMVIWQKIAHFYETATPIERGRLRRMIGPNADRFDRSGHTEAGTLFGVPEQAVLEWADGSEDGVALLLDFYPTVSSTDDVNQWHSALATVAERYGRSTVFMQALEKRMHPSSWSGSIVPLLEVYLAPLESWYKHPVEPLARWAKKIRKGLEDRIEREREYEAAHDL